MTPRRRMSHRRMMRKRTRIMKVLVMRKREGMVMGMRKVRSRDKRKGERRRRKRRTNLPPQGARPGSGDQGRTKRGCEEQSEFFFYPSMGRDFVVMDQFQSDSALV